MKPRSSLIKQWMVSWRQMPHRFFGDRSLLTLVLIQISALTSMAGQWPAWRGPEGTGVATETPLPTRWTTNENVRWRVRLPEPGNSTPIIWDQRVFISQAVGTHRKLICLDR